MAMYKYICLHVYALISPDMIFLHSWLYSPKMQEPWIMKQSLYNFRDQELDFDCWVLSVHSGIIPIAYEYRKP